MTNNKIRLGVNIDHVATLRNARGEHYPDPVQAALQAQAWGADGITAHLREDRRHIVDDDITRLMDALTIPLNFEMAVTDEMLNIALDAKPHAVCLVPEKREERTTEGGLDVAGQMATLAPFVKSLSDAGIRVSLFIEADPSQIRASADVAAAVIELHTGTYANLTGDAQKSEYQRLHNGAVLAHELGLEVHAGHGITYDNVTPIAQLPHVAELNIGHFLIGEAVFVGLDASLQRMRDLMNNAI